MIDTFFPSWFWPFKFTNLAISVSNSYVFLVAGYINLTLAQNTVGPPTTEIPWVGLAGAYFGPHILSSACVDCILLPAFSTVGGFWWPLASVTSAAHSAGKKTLSPGWHVRLPQELSRQQLGEGLVGGLSHGRSGQLAGHGLTGSPGTRTRGGRGVAGHRLTAVSTAGLTGAREYFYS